MVVQIKKEAFIVDDLPQKDKLYMDLKWFEQNGVKVQLLRECVKISSDEKYLTNGKLHSVNDEPAFIFTRFEMGGPFTVIKINIRAWYQNGLQHRDNGPAVIRSDGQVMYFQHGKQIRSINK